MTMSATDAPLSILVVTAMYPHAEQPGSGAFVRHQVQGLQALGHHVTVVHVRGYASKWQYVIGAMQVWRETWRRRYDVVHVHYGLTGLCALLRWRAPLVVTLHGSDALHGTFQPFISRIVSRVASATVVVSEEIARRYPGTLIPCGVDLDTFTQQDRTRARRELGWPVDGKIVLFPFDPDRRVKRHDIASAAVGLLSARGVPASLVAVWNVPNDRMPLYYSAADVMVLCSDSEGSPTSVKEALACGLPVVSTDVGDVRSLMGDIAGTEICEQTASSVAEALARALTRPVGIPFHGRTAMQRFDQRATIASLIDVYRTVVRNSSRSSAFAASRSRYGCS
jgi:teichuronic acid biosynthesis glycosyltransferase TuaC